MFLLGLVLLAASAAFTGLAIADNTTGGPDYGVTVLGNHIGTLGPLAIFAAGIALALLFCLGLAMMAAGTVRGRRRRKELAVARRQAADAAAERDAVAAGAPQAGEPEAGTRPASSGPRHRHARHLFGH